MEPIQRWGNRWRGFLAACRKSNPICSWGFPALLSMLWIPACQVDAQDVERLPGTEALQFEGDIASAMIDGVDRFLLRETKKAIDRRTQAWQSPDSTPEAFRAFVEDKRIRLAGMLGVREERLPFEAPELIATTKREAHIATSPAMDVYSVRWPVLEGVTGEGLLLIPKGGKAIGDFVAIPDADQSPEQFAGLDGTLPGELQLARRLAEAGYRVVVPTLISREMKKRAPSGRPGRANLTNREYIHRSAYVLGRHLIGYELQKVFACIDWFSREHSRDPGDPKPASSRFGVCGYGEGGMLALYAAALDTRIDIACVSGHFGPRNALWAEPIDRNVFGQLQEVGGAELASMVFPRTLVVDFRPGPQVDLPSEGGSPGTLQPVPLEEQKAELMRMLPIVEPILRTRQNRGRFQNATRIAEAERGIWWNPGDSPELRAIQQRQTAPVGVESGVWNLVAEDAVGDAIIPTDAMPDAGLRQQRQLEQLDRYNQTLLQASSEVRRSFMAALDTTSLAAYKKSVEPYREKFGNEVIGSFSQSLLPLRARSRRSWEAERWTGYEVMLDVFPDVFAYGVLLLPKDLKAGERRPVVVCQHGLEGRPTDVFQGDHRAYHDFAASLCERGFITFAPQNIYIFQDRFRTLQRKANPMGKTLFSVMIPQHQQIVRWLQQQPMVDPQRIAFYGLSYGGKSAMRIPAMVPDYCLSICSADFNEWVLKNASTREPFSYVWTPEYEIFEWNLGHTFNYAEMAALICPRPFMVERGHFDGVGTDEWVAFEYAKVRHLYQAKLGIGDRTEIEWFVGPHTIHGEGTFQFLHRHLQWPQPK